MTSWYNKKSSSWFVRDDNSCTLIAIVSHSKVQRYNILTQNEIISFLSVDNFHCNRSPTTMFNYATEQSNFDRSFDGSCNVSLPLPFSTSPRSRNYVSWNFKVATTYILSEQTDTLSAREVVNLRFTRAPSTFLRRFFHPFSDFSGIYWLIRDEYSGNSLWNYWHFINLNL